MKNITLALISVMASLLLVRYYPYISREMFLEYVMAACLSSRVGKLMVGNTANLVKT